MIALLSSPFLIGVCLLAFVLYIFSRAYPSPYPGIPYHLASARRLWGDSPGLIAAIKHEPNKWVFDQNRNLGSPVAQLFLAPFSKPTIIIDDVREVKDILSNRTNVFDRAARTQDAYRDLLPHCSLVKLTTPAFKAQRRFWEGVTGTPFLRRVAEPKIYRCALGLVELFKAQAEMAGGRPFHCFDGFDVAAFELIWEVVFGTPENAINSARNDVHKAIRNTTQPASLDSAAELPKVVKPYMCDTVSFFISTIAQSLRSVFPSWKLWYLRLQPAYRARLAWKTNIIDEHIEHTRAKLAGLSEEQLDGLEETSSVVTGVRRQLLAQIREGGPNNVKFSSLVRDEIHDELFMLLVAGHETKAVLLSWSIKYLTANPEKQQKLRKALVDALPKEAKGKQPSLKAISSTSIPYLDAYVEESIRVANTSPRFVRKTMTDTQVLGYQIPKGATVFLNPYIGTKQFDVQETLRSLTSCNSKDSFESYCDPKGMDDFQPERWLADDGSFNPRQYPRLAFSAGPRMCYGRNLALMEFRINLVLLVLNFNFEPLPKGLDGMESQQRLFRMPRQCYIRLSPL